MNFLKFRICSSIRRYLPLFLISYFLLLTILLLKVPTNMSPNIQSHSSFMTIKQRIVDQNDNKDNGPMKQKDGDMSLSIKTIQHTTEFSGKNKLYLLKPPPLSIPPVSLNKKGSFYVLSDNVFVYAAYYDDRKNDTFIRLLTFAKQSASKTSIFCHFKDEIYKITRQALRYELCENHGRLFGGYIFSCEVPEFLNTANSKHVTISYGTSKDRVVIPVQTVRPPRNKLKFLESYVGDASPSSIPSNDKRFINEHKSRYGDIQNSGQTISSIEDTARLKNSNINEKLPSISFAVCVSPLFGKISPYRLIEFLELTFLLGANHIFFYDYNISDDIRKVLLHYETKGLITLTPWSLPSSVTSDRVWYNGQLLAHNDCLYRSMARFDLVAFNDIDEFIIPHDNKSTTWFPIFWELISNSTCGLSFKSAFFDPESVHSTDQDLITPRLTIKTKNFSKFRSKVMLVPWRVFEVGIHHISKQNRENWTVRRVEPAVGYLHHYRQCVSDMVGNFCGSYDRDDTINRRYYPKLKTNYDRAIATIFPHR